MHNTRFFMGVSTLFLINLLRISTVLSERSNSSGGMNQVINQSVSDSESVNVQNNLASAENEVSDESDDSEDFEDVINSHEMHSNATEFQCVEDSLDKNGEIMTSEVDICKAVSLQCLHDSLQTLLEDPNKQVSGRDYACILLNLLQRNTEHTNTVTSLESALKKTENELNKLTKTVDSHDAKFIPIDKLNYFEHLDKINSDFETNAAQRVQKLEEQVTNLTQDMTVMEMRRSNGESQIKKMVLENQKHFEELSQKLNSSVDKEQSQFNAFEESLLQLENIGNMWSEISTHVEQLESRSSKTEVEMVSKIQEISTNLTILRDQVVHETDRVIKAETTLRQDLLETISTSSKTLETNLTQKIDDCQDTCLKSHATLAQELDHHTAQIHTEMENATRSMKELLQVPIKSLDSLEVDLNSLIVSEKSRAQRAEAILAETLLKHTATNVELQAMINNEVQRATLSEDGLQNLIKEQKSKLVILSDDMRAQINIESLRAKGTEAQLSSIITKEMEKTTKGHTDVQARMEKLASVLIEESKRAMNAEEELESKIAEEISRAQTTESGLLDNINDELKRASEREDVLKEMSVGNGHKINLAEEKVATLQKNLDKQIENCDQVVNVNVNLNNNFAKMMSDHVTLKDHLNARMNNETERAERVEGDILKAITQLANQSVELEGKIVAELTTHTEKVETALLSQRNLTEELGLGFNQVKVDHAQNYSLIVDKMTTLGEVVVHQLDKVASATGEAGKNFTVHLLTLASEVDDKIDALSNRVNERFEKLESEISELNAFKTPPKPVPTQSSGVFNRIVGFFARRPNSRNGTKTIRRNLVKKNNNLTVTKQRKSSEPEVKVDKDKKEGDPISTRLRVEDVFSEEKYDDEHTTEEELITQLTDGIKLRRKGVGSGRQIPIMIQRSNSKIRNIYG